MDPVLGSILVEAATRVGAPLVKSLLERFLGDDAAEVGGVVIDTVAKKLGVQPDEIAEQPPEKIDAAIKETESLAPDLLIQWNVQQAQAIALQKAEMDKVGEPTWTWAWRPAWMWFLGGLWLFRFVIVPTVDAGTGSSMATALPFDTLFWLTATFSGFYMGGHTLKDGLAKWLGRPQ
ncbi:MAG TPA: hypothetical protein VGV39_01020 [Mesorhizobium sp.]|jgi:hypothetical protein|uniref:hypothetical protein n=1 Tax=Mesorhizobium sp. TaxID=1871066 RepID=UPI002DDD5C4B|nr:hypothetical protein [Mesorhizobium sp.]HEV2501623.1 hypothetical protein [Mesorhizobium sp.]